MATLTSSPGRWKYDGSRRVRTDAPGVIREALPAGYGGLPGTEARWSVTVDYETVAQGTAPTLAAAEAAADAVEFAR